MPPSLGVNLRVTGHCSQGGRKYMEDVFSVAYQQTEDEKDLEYAFFGIFDGHGGREAAQYAKAHLMDNITSNRNFWSEDDQLVLKAIREGFLWTQQCMWKELPKWKRTNSGLPSTAGTTASVCFIKRGKLFIGHVGDSGIVLGERDPNHHSRWRTKMLTREHKPDCEIELARIKDAGGKVVNKAGVPRVVWYRPSNGHRGPVRRSTPIEEVPFLAVARALGDLWSYNAKDDVFVVSPDPDVHVYELNVLKDRCLVLATDGAWNVLSPEMAVQSVSESERNNERHMINAPQGGFVWVNPSKRLVDLALKRWDMCNLRADNTSIVTVMLDPPGPPRAQVLKRLYGVSADAAASGCPSAAEIGEAGGGASATTVAATLAAAALAAGCRESEAVKPNIAIISRFPNSSRNEEQEGKDLITSTDAKERVLPSNIVAPGDAVAASAPVRIVHDSTKSEPLKTVAAHRALNQNHDPSTSVITAATAHVLRRGPSIPRGIGLLGSDDDAAAAAVLSKQRPVITTRDDDGVQINEVSSSDIEDEELTDADEGDDPPALPQKTLPKRASVTSAQHRHLHHHKLPCSTPNLLREVRDLQSNASSLSSSAKRTLRNSKSVGGGGGCVGGCGLKRGDTPTAVRNRRDLSHQTAPRHAAGSLQAAASSGILKSPAADSEVSPRVLRPRNTPAKTPTAAAVVRGGGSAATAGHLPPSSSKRKRRSAVPSNPDQAAKLLRSASRYPVQPTTMAKHRTALRK